MEAILREWPVGRLRVADRGLREGILFNMIANPVSGKIYVSNTDAQNLTRFEGPGTISTTVPTSTTSSPIHPTVRTGNATGTPSRTNTPSAMLDASVPGCRVSAMGRRCSSCTWCIT